MGLVEVEGLTKRYKWRVAVEDVTFYVEEGRVTGLLGPNGAGKTTIIRCILGLARPDRGHVRVLGETVLGGLPPRVAREVGYVPETPEAPPWLTACELLEYLAVMEGMSSLDARVQARRALALLGAEDFCGRRLGGLSKGERKRVLIAQAFLQPRSVYLMDEPMAGLDAEWIAEVRRLISEATGGEGAAVLLSSHLLKEVEGLASSVVVLKKRVLYRGGVEDLLSKLTQARKVVADVDDAKRALDVLRAKGLKAQLVSAKRVEVLDADVEDVVIALKGIVRIYGVTSARLDLEEAYLALVRGEGGG